MEHLMSLTETDTRGWMAVCRCGWMSNVHQTTCTQPKVGGPKKWHPDLAQEAARGAFSEHLESLAIA